MHFQRRFDDLGFKIGYAVPATLAMSRLPKASADIAWGLLSLPYSHLDERKARRTYERSVRGQENACMQRVMESLSIDGKPPTTTNGRMPFVVQLKARSSADPIKKVMLGRHTDGQGYTEEEFRDFFGEDCYRWYWIYNAVPLTPPVLPFQYVFLSP